MREFYVQAGGRMMTPDEVEEAISGRIRVCALGPNGRVLPCALSVAEREELEAAKGRGWAYASSGRLQTAWRLYCEAHALPFVYVCPAGAVSEVKMDLVCFPLVRDHTGLSVRVNDLAQRCSVRQQWFAGILSRIFTEQHAAPLAAAELVRIANDYRRPEL